MPEITFDDKDHAQPSSDVRRKWRDEDANEVKRVVNQNINYRGLINGAINRYPDPEAGGATSADNGSGEDGEILQGNYWFFNGAVLVDDGTGVASWPNKTRAEALVDNPGQDPAKWRLS